MTKSSDAVRSDRPKPAKRMLSVRVGDNGYQHIVDRAERADVDMSHMVRRMLTYAAQHMPEGWVPSKGER